MFRSMCEVTWRHQLNLLNGDWKIGSHTPIPSLLGASLDLFIILKECCTTAQPSLPWQHLTSSTKIFKFKKRKGYVYCMLSLEDYLQYIHKDVYCQQEDCLPLNHVKESCIQTHRGNRTVAGPWNSSWRFTAISKVRSVSYAVHAPKYFPLLESSFLFILFSHACLVSGSCV